MDYLLPAAVFIAIDIFADQPILLAVAMIGGFLYSHYRHEATEIRLENNRDKIKKLEDRITYLSYKMGRR